MNGDGPKIPPPINDFEAYRQKHLRQSPAETAAQTGLSMDVRSGSNRSTDVPLSTTERLLAGPVLMASGATAGLVPKVAAGFNALTERALSPFTGETRGLGELYRANDASIQDVLGRAKGQEPVGAFLLEGAGAGLGAALTPSATARSVTNRMANESAMRASAEGAQLAGTMRPNLLGSTLRLGGQVGKGMIEGGAFGAAAGATTGESPDSLGELIWQRALPGALGGATFGGLIPAAAAGLGKGGQILEAMADLTGVAPAGLMQRSAERAAAQRLGTQFRRSPKTPGQILAEAQAPDVLGKQMTLAELMGSPGTRELETIAGLPGGNRDRIQQFFEQRQAAQPGRVMADISEGLGIPGAVDPVEHAAAQVARQRETSTPLYNAAMDIGAVDDPNVMAWLQTHVNDPVVKQAMDRAEQTLMRDARAGTYRGPMPQTPLFAMDETGPRISRPPTVAELQRIKQSLQGIVGRSVNRPGLEGLDAVEAGQLTGLASDLRERTRQAVPAYAAADDLFAGEQELQNAFGAGRNFLTEARRAPAEMRAAFQPLGPGEQEQFRLGSAAGIKQQLGTLQPGRDVTPLVAPANVQGMLGEIAANPEAREQMLARLGTERELPKAPRQILGGSPTAPRLEAREDYNAEMMPDVAAASGNPFRALLGAIITPVARGGQRVLQIGGERRAKAYSDLLLASDPDAIANAIQQYLRAHQAQTAQQQARRAATNAGIVTAGQQF